MQVWPPCHDHTAWSLLGWEGVMRKQQQLLFSRGCLSSVTWEAEIRNTILAQVLDQAARARLSNLALVKPDKAKAVENYLIQMARFGQLAGKVSEQGLIEILEKVSQQTEKKTTVKFNRRKVLDSDEEDDY
uniref:Programmed cell death protein 5 n=1 Tax=Cyanoderma ruficeps TaxID=181631 RepID=A0A8C3QF82_9PASS